MKKAQLKILQEINKSIPKELLANLTKKVERYALQKQVMAKALEDDEFPEEKKEIYRNLLTAGHLDVIDEVENEETTQTIFNYIKGEVEKRVANKELPQVALKNLNKVIKLTKQQHENN